MSETAEKTVENHVFEADVARLLHLMVHSVYSDKDVFLRELISNAADACEKLRYEAITHPEMLGHDAQPHISLTLDEEARRLVVEDNGIGMSEETLAAIRGGTHQGGIGINNVHNRIRLYYGEAYGLDIDSESGVGTRISLRIPYRRKEETA